MVAKVRERRLPQSTGQLRLCPAFLSDGSDNLGNDLTGSLCPGHAQIRGDPASRTRGQKMQQGGRQGGGKLMGEVCKIPFPRFVLHRLALGVEDRLALGVGSTSPRRHSCARSNPVPACRDASTVLGRRKIEIIQRKRKVMNLSKSSHRFCLSRKNRKSDGQIDGQKVDLKSTSEERGCSPPSINIFF